MSIAQKLHVAKQHYPVATARGSQTSWHNNPQPIRRRSAIELAGAFLLLTAFVLVGAATRTAPTKAADGTNASSKNSDTSANLQIDSTPTTPPASSDSTTSPTTTDTDVSSSQNTTSTDSSTTTQVTVNGQSVAVPANGTTQQTITTPGQHTTVQIDKHTVSDGNNNTSTHTFVNTHSSSTTDEQEGDQ